MTIADAQRQLERGEFAIAVHTLTAIESRDPAWYELMATASYGTGAYEDAVGAWEQLHALHRSAGERVLAARAAVMTAMFLLIDAGLLSTVRGWARRAERLLENEDDTPVHSLIAAVTGYERFFSGDLIGASRGAKEAIRLGEQFDVMPAVVIGRTASGRIAILEGDVDGGLSQLEEVLALLMSGEVDDLVTGMMFCELICAAQGILRPDLAREWTDAMARWGVTAAFGSIRGRCRVHQAELLRLSGPGEEAERVALQACEELRPWMRREFGWPLVELGLARLQRGDLAGAEETLTAAAAHAWPVHPGLALVRLEQGNLEEAAAQVAAAIAHPVDAPSKELPPFGDLRLVALFDAQSEIAWARRDAATAAEAAERLASTAALYRSPALTAVADLAAARRRLLTPDPSSAVAPASSAVATFAGLDAPFDTARARVVLAAAHEASSDVAAAARELAAARGEFARYGAFHRVAAIDGRLDPTRPSPPPTPAAEQLRGVLQADGPMWRVELDGRTARVKDLKGIHYLRRMIADPGREFHVLDLVAVEEGTLRTAGERADGLPVLDGTARDAYRRRLEDIADEIEEAARFNDLGRLARVEADRDYLVAELSRTIGLGGRIRRTGDSAERARTSVARTIRYAIDQLADAHPPVADHLRHSVRTGMYCSYVPDSLATVTWTL